MIIMIISVSIMLEDARRPCELISKGIVRCPPHNDSNNNENNNNNNDNNTNNDSNKNDTDNDNGCNTKQ